MQSIVGAFCAAALFGLALVAFGTAFGRLHPWIDLFGQFLLPAMGGGVALALIAIFTGRFGTLALTAAALLVLTALGVPWMQAPAEQPAGGPRFTLMSFNVYFYNAKLDGTVALVRARRPDILVFLEVTPVNRPGLAALEGDYPHRVECWQIRPCDALVMSRYPLADLAATLPEPASRRPLGAVALEIEGRKLAVFAAHLSLPYPLDRRHRQPGEVAEIASAIASVAGPRVLAGDFNASSWGHVMTSLRERTGMTLLTGAGATWPTFLPFHLGIPIDHVLASDDLVLRSREVVTLAGSDHRAVIAEIAFKE